MSLLDPAERREQAAEIAAIWGRVSSRHFAAGQGCGCGFGGLVLQASDFELDIVEFLLHDARKEGAANVEAFVAAVAARGPDRYSLSALLEAILTTDDKAMIESGGLDFVIMRLRKTLTSIDSAHRSGRFSCT